MLRIVIACYICPAGSLDGAASGSLDAGGGGPVRTGLEVRVVRSRHSLLRIQGILRSSMRSFYFMDFIIVVEEFTSIFT